MKTSEFDYFLPPELIATHPAEPRDAAKLLILDKNSGNIQDKVFSDISSILTDNDVLVLNKSKVIPARLHGQIHGRLHEILLLRQTTNGIWESWVRGGGKLKAGDMIEFTENLKAEYLHREEEIFFLKFDLKGSAFARELAKIGEMPVPPYILKARKESHAEVIDNEEYQTIYASVEGSVAAPTAGLHFTDELFAKLHEKGAQFEFVTLHVGLGTFQPLNVGKIEDFQIHSEFFELDPATAERLNKAKMAGKRIIAIGTTSVRVLESAAVRYDACGLQNPGNLEFALMPKSGETDIYIYPGYKFKFVDAMITNFHLPKSSLLLLVSAFAGKENIEKAYQHAITEKYRFYSYGDAMFIK
jgi:S-adenosylmethionine:tRNA ribosyltransferase-isomerase